MSKNTIAFDGDIYVSNALDFGLKLRTEERNDEKNIYFLNIIHNNTHVMDLDLLLG